MYVRVHNRLVYFGRYNKYHIGTVPYCAVCRNYDWLVEICFSSSFLLSFFCSLVLCRILQNDAIEYIVLVQYCTV